MSTRGRAPLPGLVLLVLLVTLCDLRAYAQAQDVPLLTRPVNDFAGVVDAASAAQMDGLIRALQQASGDVVIVATVRTFKPYADISEFANKLFENGGRGVGERGRDNGALVVLAVDDRQVRVEVGYDLEAFITDGFAGETSRDAMAPQFRRGAFGPGLLAGVSRIVERIASQRNVRLTGVPPVTPRRSVGSGSRGSLMLAAIVLFLIFNAIAGRTRGMRGRHDWGGAPWSGWHSGVGPFGGGRGGFGGFGGGGFGGGFGGFGGGGSGGGGGGSSW